MAVMTRGDIVSEGMLLAGRDDLAARCNVWLQRWLDSQAGAWPWPQLLQQVEFDLAADSNALTFGNDGPGGTLEEAVLRVIDNIWLYNSDRTIRGRVRLRQRFTEPKHVLYTTTTGLPDEAQLSHVSHGRWKLSFFPKADRAYKAQLDLIVKQADLANDAAIPWYPNDATMIQLVATECHRFDDGPDSEAYQASMASLGQLVSSDRMRYGAYPGIHDQLQLDTTVFR